MAGIINDGVESAALHPDLRFDADDVVLKKPLFGSCQETDMDLLLRRGIETVIVGGIATNFCAETTAREATARDYRVVFLSDGTAMFDLPGSALGPATAEEVQRVTCATLSFDFAEVSTVADVADRLASAPLA
jgi:ureidoacrylate peracid hydrolase